MDESGKFPEGVKVKSLYKAVKMLDYFTEKHPERGISELAELTGMLRSSVYNILSTFEVCGIVEKDPATNKYHLGTKIMMLGNVVNIGDVFADIIRPVMERLSEQTGETSFFATPYGNQIIYREAAFPQRSISVRTIRGVIAPMYCTSLGKAILAYMEQNAVESVIEGGLKPFTENTITDPDAFREEIREIKVRGYSVDNMEHEYGIKCVGVPIFNQEDEVIGAISLTGPSLRFDGQKTEEYAVLLKKEIAKLKQRL